LLLGHFGTYGSQIAPMLQDALIPLLTADVGVDAVCAGAGSDEFVRSLVAADPALRGRLHATGRTDAAEVSVLLTACDLLLQPYPDGVTTRRTSVMAGLINARPVLTTTGHLTEDAWAETGAVALTPAADRGAYVESARRLLADPIERAALALRGNTTYRERFSLERTVSALRGVAAGVVASP
jgi:glycosyltransferase involved in cell wall biosynthesis